MQGATKLMEEVKARFPADLDYVTSLDTTLAVSEGIREIVKTLVEALVLVVIVVFVFLQGFRATLIPLLAVPVSLVGTFMVFPLLGFSINTLSLFGLVLAIGLVVDDAIVVVEAVEHHIEQGLSPRDAAFKAMEQVSGPVVAIALILAAVFVPTAFIPGITGRMYQQFAVTIAVSVLISAFNALTLSPALSALLLRPKREMRGPLGAFFRGFNRWFARATDGYVGACGHLIRKSACLDAPPRRRRRASPASIGSRLPGGFVPDEDQGYFYVNVQLPLAASLERTAAVNDKLDAIFKTTPGVKYYTGVAGFSLLSCVTTTYNAFYFVTLEDWDERDKKGLTADVIMRQLNQRLAGVAEAQAFAFSPPAIPGIGTSGGVTFMLEDRAGRDPAFLAENTEKFLAAARKRPEFARLFTTLLPSVPQFFAEVDRDKVLKQGIDALLGLPDPAGVHGRRLRELLQPVRAGLAGVRPGRGRVPHPGRERRSVLRAQRRRPGGAAVHAGHHESRSTARSSPCGSTSTARRRSTDRSRPATAPGRACRRSRRCSRETMPREMGFDYLGMSFQEKVAAEGIPPAAVFGFSLLVVFLLLAAQYESWTLPFGVLLGTPIAVLGAVGALWLGRLRDGRVLPDRPGHGDRPGGQERHPDRRVRQGGVRARRLARRRRAGRRARPAAAHPHDRVRVHPRRAAARDRARAPAPTRAGSWAPTVIGGMLAATLIAIFIIPVTFYVSERFGRKPASAPAAADAAAGADHGGAADEPPADGGTHETRTSGRIVAGDRRGRAPGRLRDRPGLQAPARGRAPTFRGQADRRGGLARRRCPGGRCSRTPS